MILIVLELLKFLAEELVGLLLDMLNIQKMNPLGFLGLSGSLLIVEQVLKPRNLLDFTALYNHLLSLLSKQDRPLPYSYTELIVEQLR